MKISGCTIARKAKTFDYPVVESINSILPVCDEFVVNIGQDNDGTKEEIESIGSNKIRFIRPVWDENKRDSGKIYSCHTNLVLDECKGDWIFYMQADELLHENDLKTIQEYAEKYKDDVGVDGFSFNVLDFYGSFKYIIDDFGVKKNCTRIIRNKKNIRSWGDAWDFKKNELDSELPLNLIKLPVNIYHYGWCRNPEKMAEKMNLQDSFYNSAVKMKAQFAKRTARNIYKSRLDLACFTGSHPSVMKNRIESINWSFHPNYLSFPPRWLKKILLKSAGKLFYKLGRHLIHIKLFLYSLKSNK